MSALQDELKQRRPFRSAGHECAVSLLRTADLLRHVLGAVVGSHGLTLQQYNVLRILRGSGPEGLPTLDIADRLVERAPGVTRLLERLERKGLVRRQRCADDRRQVLCWITSPGLRLLSSLDRPMSEADDRLLQHLGQRRTVSLVRLLQGVREGLQSHNPGPR